MMLVLRLLMLLLLALALSNHPLLAQYKLSGVVQDEQGAGLSFSTVMLLNDEEEFLKGEITDLNGSFAFTALPAASYILSISTIGYEPLQYRLSLSSHLDVGKLQLVQGELELEEVVVQAQKVAFERKADRTIVNVASLPTAAGGNALELLEKSPSVRLDRLNGTISLMGREDVIIFIDNKRTRLSGNELVQYLSTLPASTIATLELINTPPASYDADGTGGVINIQTQTGDTDGLTGSLSTYAGYGQRSKYGASAQLNYRHNKLMLYGEAATTQDYTNQNSEISTAIAFDSGLLQTHQESLRPAYIGNYSGKAGLSYALSPATSVDVFASVARRRWELEAETSTAYSGTISPIAQDLLTGEETNTTNQYMLSARVQHKLTAEHRLSGDVDYLNFKITNPTRYTLQDFDPAGGLVNETRFFTSKETPFDFYVGRVDYQGDLSEALQVESGLKFSRAHVTNRTALLNARQEVDASSIFSDDIFLREHIYASYLSAKGLLTSKLEFNVGLRYEYSSLDLSARRDTINRHLSRFFPVLSLTKTFNEASRLTIAYRERISRPGFQNLAPAFFYLNPYTVLTGNVQALPNTNRTLEATLHHQALFISLSYALDDNPIVNYAIPVLDQADNLLLLISDNIDQRRQLGLTIGFPVTMTRFWSANYNFGGHLRRDELRYTDQQIVVAEPFFTIQTTQEFQLGPSWAVELSGSWNSRVYQGTIFQPRQASLHLGIQKQFDRATLGLSWTDLFDTGTFLGFVNDLPGQAIAYNWDYDFEGSIIRLSYSYRFGGKDLTKARSSGASEVLQRVGQ